MCPDINQSFPGLERENLMAAMLGIQKTGDFYQNVLRALKEQGGDSQALRLDVLADLIEPTTTDGSHRWRVFDKVKAAINSESLGLSESPFELISAREQEGYGFSQEVFPRSVMGERPGVRKKTRKARAAVAEAAGTDETKPVVNYWPIVAIKNPVRANMRKDIEEIADFNFKLIRDKYDGRYDVVLGSKSFTVKMKMDVSSDIDEDEEESVEA